MNVNDTAAEKQSVKHKCGICSFSTMIPGSYKRHMKTHLSEKPFKCPECPYRAKLKGNIATHLRHVHQSSRPFPCPNSECNFAAKDKSDLNKHLKIHLDEKSLFCSYPNCSYATNEKGRLTKHSRIHLEDKPFLCQFESCSYATATKNYLVSHSRTHTKEKLFKCPETNCDYSTSQQGNIKTHQITHHPKEGEQKPSFRCSVCEFSTKYKSALNIHVKRKHSDEKPFACSFESCEFRCKTKGVLSQHLTIHKDERKYKCQLCPFRGKTRSTVLNHLKNVHSDVRLFKCGEPNCNHASKTTGDLKRHLLTHNPEKSYACSFPNCNYRGIGKFQVKAHENNIHCEEKKEKCPLCDFKCKKKSGLLNHVRTHTKETPYKCKENGCEYRGKSSAAIQQHEKRSHPLIYKETK